MRACANCTEDRFGFYCQKCGCKTVEMPECECKKWHFSIHDRYCPNCGKARANISAIMEGQEPE